MQAETANESGGLTTALAQFNRKEMDYRQELKQNMITTETQSSLKKAL